MKKSARKYLKIVTKGATNVEMRKKLGITQTEFASIFGVSRPQISLVETGKRDMNFPIHELLTNMYLQFLKLENGEESASRSLETKLFLNDAYKKVLPEMKILELERRTKIKRMKKELEQMKARAREAANAIIVYTTAINNLKENPPSSVNLENLLTGLDLFKQRKYEDLISCWEPEQAKLHSKIEALAGEAKALRRYRIKVIREHDPLKD